jgi:hypothetical protein
VTVEEDRDAAETRGSAAAEESEDDVVEITPSPRRPSTARANKRQKIAHTDSTKGIAGGKGDTTGKGKASTKRSKRVLSDTEDEAEEPDVQEQEDVVVEVRDGASTAGSAKLHKAGKSKATAGKKAKIVLSDDEDEADHAIDEGGKRSQGVEREDAPAVAVGDKDPEPLIAPKGKAKDSESDGDETSPTKRSPLRTLPAGANTDTITAASSKAGPSKPLTTAPGGVKWRTRMWMSDQQSAHAHIFGSLQYTDFNRTIRSRIPLDKVWRAQTPRHVAPHQDCLSASNHRSAKESASSSTETGGKEEEGRK